MEPEIPAARERHVAAVGQRVAASVFRPSERARRSEVDPTVALGAVWPHAAGIVPETPPISGPAHRLESKRGTGVAMPRSRDDQGTGGSAQTVQFLRCRR